MCRFTLDSTHFIFNKCPIYTHDSASVKFRTNKQKTDYSAYDYATGKSYLNTDSWKAAAHPPPLALTYTVKKVSNFPVPNRDITNQTFPGRE